MTQTISQDETALSNWILVNGGTREQITSTVYDLYYGFPNEPTLSPLVTQRHLRNRVSYTATRNLATDPDFYTATFYTYDIHGNVDTLLQDYKGLAEMSGGDRYKRIVYAYDLISGKVIMVSYQPEAIDAFYHRYEYDAENRLVSVHTSRDKIYWETDAQYQYYKHGPLARTTLGQLAVQGVDYAYTLNGWLKGVNSSNLMAATDMGNDENPPARDVFGFALHYYDNGAGQLDYKPIGGSSPFARPANTDFKSLFNGNIAGMTVHNAGLLKGDPNALPLFNNYRYDQLNRLVGMQVYTGLDISNNEWSSLNAINDYKEAITYDPNGNILSYLRNGDAARTSMDNLSYYYKANTNQLHKVTDAAADASPSDYSRYNDIKQGQGDNNYQYDAIGNLVSDNSESIREIQWTVYGKISSITKDTDNNPLTTHDRTIIEYGYDAGGNRISKKVTSEESGIAKTNTTIYVRDASGNVMSVYEKRGAEALTQAELHLYGSSRLGMVTEKPVTSQVTLNGDFGTATAAIFTRGNKFFELSNHLGNVLATVSDKKLQRSTDNETVDYYEADIASANDYYPFGSLMPGRKWTGGKYRYGFNGKENDGEVKGDGNQQDYGMRIYDPRLGRFLSVDPLSRDFPYFSVYHFAGCSPIKFIDLDGGEPKDYVDNWVPRPMGWFGTNRLVEGTSEGNSSIMLEDPALGWIRVQAIYDETTKSNWFIHHNSGTGKYYYYKADDNQHGVLTIQIPKNGLAIISGGFMEEFETADAEAARIRIETADLLTATTVGTIVGLPGILEYGGAVMYKIYQKIIRQRTDSNKNKEEIKTKNDETEQEITPEVRKRYSKKAARESAKRKRESQPASEAYVKKYKAKKLEDKYGKDARRRAHDKKERGAGDRSKRQIDEDYQID